MKMIITIIQDEDERLLGQAFREADIAVTKLSTTGGFLKSGNTTFLSGVEDGRVNEVLALIKENCQSRKQYIPSPINYDLDMEMTDAFPIRVDVGGAIVFVLPVDSFYRF